MQRVLCDVDNLSPKYAHTHEEKEVRAWSETAGFKDVRAVNQSISVISRRTSLGLPTALANNESCDSLFHMEE